MGEKAEENVPHLFDLTKMTGKRRNEDRSVFIATVEVERRTFFLLLSGLPAAIAMTGITFPLLRIWSLFMFFVVLAAWTLFFGHRRSSGLQVSMFDAAKDKKTSTAGKFLMCGQVIDPLHGAGDFQLIHSDAVVMRSDEIDDSGFAQVVDPTASVVPLNLPSRRSTKSKRKSRRRQPTEVAYTPATDILSQIDAEAAKS